MWFLLTAPRSPGSRDRLVCRGGCDYAGVGREDNFLFGHVPSVALRG